MYLHFAYSPGMPGEQNWKLGGSGRVRSPIWYVRGIMHSNGIMSGHCRIAVFEDAERFGELDCHTWTLCAISGV